MSPTASGKCQMADPCPDCRSGRGHPPMIAVYDRYEGRYLLEPEQDPGHLICTARWDRNGIGYDKGDICGNPAQRWAGDVPLCMKHYKRFKGWVAAEDDLALERDARFHEQDMRQREELSRQTVQLELARIAALSEAKAAGSVVYYVRRISDGMIKIGYSASPRGRLNSHRREQGPIQVLLVVGGDRDDETGAHNKFSEYQIGRTEWFRPVRPLMQWILEAREGHTHPHVQPGDILPMAELSELVLAAVPLEQLRFDEETGHVLWPPTEEAA